MQENFSDLGIHICMLLVVGLIVNCNYQSVTNGFMNCFLTVDFFNIPVAVKKLLILVAEGYYYNFTL